MRNCFTPVTFTFSASKSCNFCVLAHKVIESLANLSWDFSVISAARKEGGRLEKAALLVDGCYEKAIRIWVLKVHYKTELLDK